MLTPCPNNIYLPVHKGQLETRLDEGHHRESRDDLLESLQAGNPSLRSWGRRKEKFSLKRKKTLSSRI